MNTATNSEFYERQSIKEFLGEHEVVRELYEALRKSASYFSQSSNGFLSEEEILRAFNYAYYICMRLTDGSNCSLLDAWFERAGKWCIISTRNQDYIYALVRSLLLVNRRLLSFDKMVIHDIRASVSGQFIWHSFDKFTSLYSDALKYPLNFSGLPEKAPAAQREVPTDPMQLLERAASDIAKAGERMKEQLAAKDKRIKELADQVKEEQAKVQAKEGRIKELEGWNASLSQNPFCLDKIKDYAKGLDKEEVKVITHMLLAIALEEQLPKAKQAEVRKAVKEVEAAHKRQPAYVHIERQEIHNDNKDS